MSKSTSILANAASVISTGPGSTTIANCIAAAQTAGGGIQDYLGTVGIMLTKFQEALMLLKRVKAITHATDDATNLALMAGLEDTLDGTGSPSTAVLTDIASIISNGIDKDGPGTGTATAAIAAAQTAGGGIQDWLGNCKLIQLKFQEALVIAERLLIVTASADTANKALLQSIHDVLV
jgi:hypothetical protein